MKILALDTSASASSVAISEDGRCLSQFFLNVKLTHSQTLLPMCRSALSCAGLTLNEIDAFAVSGGPGSFTGLRIGIAAVKGMAMAGEKPCCNISSLEGLAYNLVDSGGPICSVMDARCNQFYTAMFKCGESGKIKRVSEDSAISAEKLYDRLFNTDGRIQLVGDGAQLCYDNCEFKDKLILTPDPARYAHANSVALAAFANKERFQSCDALVPKYLRLPQAQRELLNREKAEKKEKNLC